MLGRGVPSGPVILDTNVFINAVSGRGPTVLQRLLEALPRSFVAAPARAELAWVLGRLNPTHPETGRVIAIYKTILGRIDPSKVLVPGDADWLAA
jgi:predicted nucleic acid-binding protein